VDSRTESGNRWGSRGLSSDFKRIAPEKILSLVVYFLTLAKRHQAEGRKVSLREGQYVEC